MADTTLTLHVLEGTRLPLTNRDILVSLWDGNQRRVHWAYHRSPDIRFTIPLADNFVDNYRVVVSTDGYRDAGQTSVVLTEDPSDLALMLLPKKPAFAFAPLDTIASGHENLSRLVVEHLQSSYGDATELTYKRLQNEFPEGLATLLNIGSAFQGFTTHPLDFIEKIISLEPDRFFAEGKETFIAFLEEETKENIFHEAPASLHPGADISYKEIRYPEANVQFTLTRLGKGKVKVDADIDYFGDLASHFFLEVFPQDVIPAILGTSKKLTNPRVAYVLRWMAMERRFAASGLAFNPPYRIINTQVT